MNEGASERASNHWVKGVINKSIVIYTLTTDALAEDVKDYIINKFGVYLARRARTYSARLSKKADKLEAIWVSSSKTNVTTNWCRAHPQTYEM